MHVRLAEELQRSEHAAECERPSQTASVTAPSHSADGSQGDGFAFGPTPEDDWTEANRRGRRAVLVPAGNTAAGLVFIDPQYYQVMTDWI